MTDAMAAYAIENQANPPTPLQFYCQSELAANGITTTRPMSTAQACLLYTSRCV